MYPGAYFIMELQIDLLLVFFISYSKALQVTKTCSFFMKKQAPVGLLLLSLMRLRKDKVSLLKGKEVLQNKFWATSKSCILINLFIYFSKSDAKWRENTLLAQLSQETDFLCYFCTIIVNGSHVKNKLILWVILNIKCFLPNKNLYVFCTVCWLKMSLYFQSDRVLINSSWIDRLKQVKVP